MKKNIAKALAVALVASSAACLGTGTYEYVTKPESDDSFSGTEETTSTTGVTSATKTAILAGISDTQWANAAADPYVVKFDKRGAATTYQFYPERALNFEVGKPYVIKFIHDGTDTGNTGADHYFSDLPVDMVGTALSNGTAWNTKGFWKSIVMKELRSRQAVFKAPYLLDFELNRPTRNGGAGTPSSTVAYLYFVPTKAGSYNMYCSITARTNLTTAPTTSHGAMRATVTITGQSIDVDYEVPQEVQGAYLTSDSRSGSYAPWAALAGNTNLSAAAAVKSAKLEVATNGALTATLPGAETTLAKNTGYQVRLSKSSNTQDNNEYLVSSNIFKKVIVRKIQDIDVQMKPVYLESVTLLADDNGVRAANLCNGTANAATTMTDTCGTYTNESGSTALGATNNSSGIPGVRSVDFWMVPVNSSGANITETISVTPTGGSANTSTSLTIGS